MIESSRYEFMMSFHQKGIEIKDFLRLTLKDFQLIYSNPDGCDVAALQGAKVKYNTGADSCHHGDCQREEHGAGSSLHFLFSPLHGNDVNLHKGRLSPRSCRAPRSN